MRRTVKIVVVFLALISLLSFSRPTQAQDRYATCDLCGFCVTSQNKSDWAQITPPTSWESCRKCLYPDANTDPKSGDTIKITDTENNLPKQPKKGTHYTGIGCFSTNLSGGFTNSGAAGSVVQTLFNVLFGFGGALAMLYLIYGAFLVITSQADPERLAQGRRTIQGAVIGILFIAGAIFLVNLIGSGILKIPGFGQ